MHDTPTDNWLDPEQYRALAGIDRAGLMWEWLRRDPEYRLSQQLSRHQATPIVTQSHGSLKIITLTSAVNANQWGLHFR